MTKEDANIAGKKARAARIKGICNDADALKVSRMHLWAVLTGHRESKPLLAKYASLKANQSPTAPSQLHSPENAMNPRFSTDMPDPADASRHPGSTSAEPLSGFPADINYTEEMAIELGQIGLSIIAIEMSKCPLGYSSDTFIQGLAKDFAKADLGKFDESKYIPKIHHFFHGITSRLPAGLEFLKSKLAQGELLVISKIWYRDAETKIWRQFYPAAAPTPK